MDEQQLAELLQQIQELAGVGLDALTGGGEAPPAAEPDGGEAPPAE